MSSLFEIQEAIIQLPDKERHALSAWMASRVTPSLEPEDEDQLLKSLDQAIHDLDRGKGISLGSARNLVSSWAGK